MARMALEIVRDLSDPEKDRIAKIKQNFPGLRWKLIDDGDKTYVMSIGTHAVAFAIDGSDDEFIYDGDEDLTNEVGFGNGRVL
jgi:hypothetical protein